MPNNPDQIVRGIVERFRTFGGGRDSDSNPLAHALRDKPAQFAAGVDVAEVVNFVLEAHAAALADRLTRLEKFTQHKSDCKILMRLDDGSQMVVPEAADLPGYVCSCGLTAIVALPQDGEARP